MQLRPTLWRTCRIIASETRLQLLWCLFEEGELCVKDLVQRTDDSRTNTSNQLRGLSARGLITPRREKMKVIYRPEANDSIYFAPDLLNALKRCFDQHMSFQKIILQATAFTHERRIETVHALNGTILSFRELQTVTQMSPASLSRHLDKLEYRKMVQHTEGTYKLGAPANLLGRALLRIARAPRSL